MGRSSPCREVHPRVRGDLPDVRSAGATTDEPEQGRIWSERFTRPLDLWTCLTSLFIGMVEHV